MPVQKSVLRWLARILGAAGLIILGICIFGNNSAEALQSIFLLIGFALLGYIFAWFREKEGGWTLVFSGVILGLTMYYKNVLVQEPTLIAGVAALILSGMLFAGRDLIHKVN